LIGEVPARRPPRPMQRRWIVIAVIVFFVFVFGGSIIRFYTDLLWFGEVGLTSVFWVTLSTRVLMGVAPGAMAALFVFANLEVAYRAAPPATVRIGIRGITDQYRAMVRGRGRLLNALAAAVVGTLVGLSSSAFWDRYLLWRNQREFAVTDPLFNRDVGFFVFNLPFQRVLFSWALGVAILTVLVVVGAHLLYGSIEPHPQGVRVEPVVKVHVSALLGAIWLLKAWGYVLQSYELVYSPRGRVVGASYTDVNAQLPALRLLTLIAIVSAAIFFLNFWSRFRSWLLPMAALGLWLFASIVLGAVFPAFVQRFQVQPNEAQRERPFIERNIEATRRAFGLDRIEVQTFPARPSLTPEVLAENRSTLDNVRVWDPSPLQQTYRQTQTLRPFYDFTDVDVDRYTIDGALTQVLLSARSINPDGLDPGAQTWVNTTLRFTHGYGLVGTQANSKTEEGQPELLVRDMPIRGVPPLTPTEPGIYFGENMPGYVIARSQEREVDHLAGEEVVTTTYEGRGGIPLTGTLRKTAFALRFGDTDLLISDRVTPESVLMMRRDVRERTAAVAPFLMFDDDPYLVAGADRLYWMVDAYTVTDRYPYSQGVSLAQVDKQGVVNYIRNSVKVLVDAYDGTMTFYVVGPERDPIIEAYQSIFPDLFTPGDQMPDWVRAHVRYPEDLFVIQTNQFGIYHMTDPQQLYSREDQWQIPQDPVLSSAERQIGMEPYYVVMRLPGSDQPEFLLMQPFTPAGRDNLNAWLAARSDPDNYGELVGFTFPRGTTVLGPVQVAGIINQDPVISAQKSLWDRAGSQVLEASLFVIPIGESLIYVQPLYLRATRGALPRLERVVVVYGDNIGFEATFEESLAAAIAGAPAQVETPDGEQPPPDAAPTPGPPAGAFDEVLQQLQQAEDALRRARESFERARREQAPAA